MILTLVQSFLKCLPDLGTDEAKAYVLSCIADTAVITPGEMKLLKDESVSISYEVTVVPGKDVFAELEAEDIWLWLANSYDMDKGEYIKVNDNAKPEVKNVIDSIEPVTTTFTITYSKTDDGYKAETEPQNVANAIFSLSSDSVS